MEWITDLESHGFYLIASTTMMAGKSTELRRQFSRIRAAGKKAIFLFPEAALLPGGLPRQKDAPGGHAPEHWSLFGPEGPQADLHPFDWILLDEAQFLGERLIPFVRRWFSLEGKNLIIAGLTTFAAPGGKPFGNILDLFHLGPSGFFFPRAICSLCKRSLASRTFLRGPKEEGIHVGGDDLYFVACHDCMPS